MPLSGSPFFCPAGHFIPKEDKQVNATKEVELLENSQVKLKVRDPDGGRAEAIRRHRQGVLAEGAPQGLPQGQGPRRRDRPQARSRPHRPDPVGSAGKEPLGGLRERGAEADPLRDPRDQVGGSPGAGQGLRLRGDLRHVARRSSWAPTRAWRSTSRSGRSPTRTSAAS